jgi:hypothetical protein
MLVLGNASTVSKLFFMSISDLFFSTPRPKAKPMNLSNMNGAETAQQIQTRHEIVVALAVPLYCLLKGSSTTPDFSASVSFQLNTRSGE